MAETVRIRISQAVGQFVSPGVPSERKLQGVAAASGMPAVDRVTLLFCLMRDADPVVKRGGGQAFDALPAEAIEAYLADPAPHPAILDAIVRRHGTLPGLAERLLALPVLSPSARAHLESLQPSSSPPVAEQAEAAPEAELPPAADVVAGCAGGDVAEDAPAEPFDDGAAVDEEAEEFLSKFKLSQMMGIGEKIKMALTGDKEWRAILIKDANKLVSGSVIKNPRITDGEILTILKVGVQNDEILRLICANKEWTKNYAIRKALVDNPKTPLPNALRYLATLGEKDIASYAKSKNISSVLSTQAKRILLSKKR